MISHPYGPARVITTGAAIEALRKAGADRQLAVVLAAIAKAATGIDLAAIDADQLHGRLGVGAWSINYFGPLYQAALSLAGPPAQLAAGGALQQATTAVAAWRHHGLAYWPEFTSGAFRGALSAAQLRQLPPAIDGRPPARAIDPTGQAAGVILTAQRPAGVTSLQRITAAAQQLHNTIGATTNG